MRRKTQRNMDSFPKKKFSTKKNKNAQKKREAENSEMWKRISIRYRKYVDATRTSLVQ